MAETKVDKMLATATQIAELKQYIANPKALEQALEAKEEEFRLLARGAAGWGPSSRRSSLPGVPIAQQVLQAVAKGPKTRGEIIQHVGGHAAAVTSALKKHKATGKLAHADGKYGPPPTTTAKTPVQVKKGKNE